MCIFTNPDHETVVRAIYTGSEFLDTVDTSGDVGLVLESTSFYAEQGGQIFDTGSLEGLLSKFQVTNVQVYGGFVLHIGSFSGVIGRISVGDNVVCKVDYERRALIAPNHTCTHMLNFALREVLGNHVDQKGSIVLPEKLRFDFSHGKPVEADKLRRIESIVNEQIEAELDVFGKEATLADAKRINGLRAVFGEVYPDPVRVVAIGQKVEDLLADPENEKWSSISAELCGGTHISNTREAKAFALLSEEGIAKGIRRITAVTTGYANDALKLAKQLEQEVDDAAKKEGSVLEESESTGVSPFEIATRQQPITPHTLAVGYKGPSLAAFKFAKGWHEKSDMARTYLERLGPYHKDVEDPSRGEARRAPTAITVVPKCDVDEIMAHWVIPRRGSHPSYVEYLIKWKGAPNSEAS
ncbi:alanine--tRNA ligase [Senna tora]|uniref:alanine--tRNA ligase n=1 Tax=Senna tora TaxID=362788 RepID=A0A834W0D9_9FABA|nr:alanine--tRNA ligase [Senna tora]